MLLVGDAGYDVCLLMAFHLANCVLPISHPWKGWQSVTLNRTGQHCRGLTDVQAC